MKKRNNWYSKLYYIFLTTVIIITIIISFIIYKTHKEQSSSSLDYYSSFNDLAKHTTKGKDWGILTKNRKDDRILVTAIHGGGIEPGTTELARRIANIGKYDFYSFEGRLPEHNEKLHITSTVFNEPILEKMLKHTDETISIHGYAGEDPVVYVGGQDKKLAKSITHSLEDKGFTVQKSPKGVEATSSDNIINRDDEESGVQLELTTGQRALFFKNNNLNQETRSNSDNYTKTFYKFAKAVNKGIKDAQ
ncbi:poly-gamma-glutamate hydrolase family protein [Staphylococcus sp. NRL 16/872]|uniref:poly-gamma-glutamate hydrolase family protein n=1 Tax=Staphylococcus sp. NRL 16/872 TaxID=2930131 RepID=UPI001FB286C6|nr:MULTISPECIES: poly-gamma-glutamate hydrolase family protein [unclassified Staphylococcus]MCJ1656861.1 poly-gamma-glutamate hydrolase family protein [Staphylococcus sp. NRL 21/187]MCJ1662609.1 poly-gamma-glutamate hydrolase family protein [Staphylococcus sp. NRL 18/288]MCJ1668710.1 poly-gamma-glutamate hydrolase family protein [Staphylococcus sp. NRL 19/737]WEN68927.1 poly-gamma-glutamate hydrolase family protein [Staphylococcus sp. NRL 16/872]